MEDNRLPHRVVRQPRTAVGEPPATDAKAWSGDKADPCRPVAFARKVRGKSR
jgi:hypothetical protein